MITRVYSKNALYQRFVVLKTNRNKRYQYGEFLVEGVRSINQAIGHGWKIASFLYADGAPLSSWAQGVLRDVQTDMNYALSPALMAELSGKTDTSEMMAVVRMRPDGLDALRPRENPLLVLFDRPSNKGNLGTLIRSCDALGADALIVTGHAVDVYDPQVVVSAMGSFFSLPVFRVSGNEVILNCVEGLRARHPGFSVVATTAHRQTPVDQASLINPCLLLVGNETDGLCRALYELADQTVTIPMAETSTASSFNVACAATVLLYEVSRQRRALS